MSKIFYVTHWQKNSWHFWLLYLYTFSLYENASLIIFSVYQLLLHMVFTSRNWFAMQGPVAIILISWNVIFIWETGYWTKAIKRFALFDLYRNKIGKIVVKTVPYSVNVNVKNFFTSHIDKKYFWYFSIVTAGAFEP
jgi:ABC-type proline/glycine betaine transport system permease subunit